MIYPDSCALAKFVIAEPESMALKAHPTEHARKFAAEIGLPVVAPGI